MPDPYTLEIDLAGVPVIVEYRVYCSRDPRDRDPEMTIEIEAAYIEGRPDLALDFDYPINRDTLGVHIESIVFEREETIRREMTE